MMRAALILVGNVERRPSSRTTERVLGTVNITRFSPLSTTRKVHCLILFTSLCVCLVSCTARYYGCSSHPLCKATRKTRKANAVVELQAEEMLSRSLSSDPATLGNSFNDTTRCLSHLHVILTDDELYLDVLLCKVIDRNYHVSADVTWL